MRSVWPDNNQPGMAHLLLTRMSSRRLANPQECLLPFWWVLGAFCKPQEANMAASGHQDGAQIEQKSMQKLMQKIDASWMCIFAFFLILGATLAPKWRQVGHPKRIFLRFN